MTSSVSVSPKVWTGVVTDPPQADDEADPRTISMTWGDVCDTEVGVIHINRGGTHSTAVVSRFILGNVHLSSIYPHFPKSVSQASAD